MFVYLGSYLFNMIMGIFFSWTNERNIRKDSKKFLLVFFIIIALISSVRSKFVGTDTLMYQTIFFKIGNNYSSIDYLNKFPGYYIFNKILFLINSSPQFIIVINSLLIAALITFAISKLSINIYLSSILYFSQYYFFSSMNISRQYLAIGFLFLSFIFILNNKKIISAILAFLLAVSFHQMALVGGIFFVIPHIKWNNKKYFLLTIITIVVLYFQNFMINLIIRILPQYASYLNASDELNLSSTGSGNRIYMTLFILFFVILGLLVTKYDLDENDKQYRSLLAISIISVSIDLVFSNNIMISRFSLYLSIFQIFYLPYSIHYFSKFFKNKTVMKYFLIILVVIITTFTMSFQLSKNQANVLPYTTVFTE